MGSELTEREALFLLRRAIQLDDEGARSRVLDYVIKRFRGMISGYFTRDPAYDRSDIESTFILGVVEGMAVVSLSIGNPLNYLAWRGLVRVKSQVGAWRKKGQEFVASTEAMEYIPAAMGQEDDEYEVVIEQTAAHQRAVRVLTNHTLQGKAADMLTLIVSGEIDPLESGANKRLASRLGVSPQRASQLMAKVRDEAARVEAL